MAKVQSMDDPFQGSALRAPDHRPVRPLILRFKLSLRDLVEIMAERGLSMAHTTIMRWVQRFVPEVEKRWNRFARKAGRSWRVDETM